MLPASLVTARPDPARPPAFVPEALLAGVLPRVPEAERAALVEAHLVHLNACEARLDLELACAVEGLSMRDVHALGHGTREDFARERLGCSWSHVRELLALGKGLRSLPLLHEAFLLGALRRARLREILRVATPDTESSWLVLARSLTSDELAARVTAARASHASHASRASRSGAPSATAEPARATERVSIRIAPEEAVFIESIGLPMLRSVIGIEGPHHALMAALAAEVLAERGHEPVEAAGSTSVDARGGSCNPSRRRRAVRARAKAAARAERLLRRLTARAVASPLITWPVAAGDGLTDRLAHAQILMRWRRSLDWQRARLLALVRERAWHVARGHASFGDWLDRRLGLAPREAATLDRLVGVVADLPAIDAAWRAGELAWPQVDKVARVASSDTADDWARFVQEATSKRLDVEVAAHAALRVHLGDEGWREATGGGRPLRDQLLGDLRLKWADVFGSTADVAGEALTGGTEPPPEGSRGSCNFPAKSQEDHPTHARTRSRAEPARPPLAPVRRSFAFDAPPEVAAEFRLALGRVHAESGRVLDMAGCVVEMFWRFAATHVVPGLKARNLRDRILRREGWTCSMPHCRNRKNLDVHHVVYRSHGGSNRRWNLVVACRPCHRLEHAGRIHAMVEDIRQSRGGIAPSLVVRVGDAALTTISQRYREGIRVHGSHALARERMMASIDAAFAEGGGTRRYLQP